MSSEFTPKFPRSIAGGDYRVPLDHPDVEAIAARADHLYRTFSLSDDDRARLIARYADIAAASEYLWGAIGEQRVADNGLRPTSRKPCTREVATSETVGGHEMARNIGFVFRYRDYVKRLEDKYGFTAWKRLGEVIRRDDELYDASHHSVPKPDDDI
ncbi:hypothetical protein AB7Z32_02855 [Bradyrhizobium sp. 482_C4_N1_1]|uniref:hypothetical protein n=1 Tax=unclassified Bradyrhizobium TaxID=2631580 RepID=UPI003F8BE9A4